MEIGAKISHMKLKIGNIHESLMIPCSSKAITCKFLPHFSKEIGIDKIYITQEQNTSLSADLEEVIWNGEHLPFIALKINSQDKSVSIKIQLGKECKTAQITLILSKFTEETEKLICFLECYKQEKWETNWKHLRKCNAPQSLPQTNLDKLHGQNVTWSEKRQKNGELP